MMNRVKLHVNDDKLLILIPSAVKSINDLVDHIKSILNLQQCNLLQLYTEDDYLLVPSEDIELLRDKDLVVVKIKDGGIITENTVLPKQTQIKPLHVDIDSAVLVEQIKPQTVLTVKNTKKRKRRRGNRGGKKVQRRKLNKIQAEKALDKEKSGSVAIVKDTKGTSSNKDNCDSSSDDDTTSSESENESDLNIAINHGKKAHEALHCNSSNDKKKLLANNGSNSMNRNNSQSIELETTKRSCTTSMTTSSKYSSESRISSTASSKEGKKCANSSTSSKISKPLPLPGSFLNGKKHKSKTKPKKKNFQQPTGCNAIPLGDGNDQYCNINMECVDDTDDIDTDYDRFMNRRRNKTYEVVVCSNDNHNNLTGISETLLENDKNYEIFPSLSSNESNCAIQKEDFIAYQILSLNMETWEPVLSVINEGVVIHVDAKKDSISIQNLNDDKPYTYLLSELSNVYFMEGPTYLDLSSKSDVVKDRVATVLVKVNTNIISDADILRQIELKEKELLV